MSNTTRIAKNTLVLYFRQIMMILVSLYTVRIKLDILGVENFGIYNLVAGVVVMFSFINVAMTNSTQRFLNFSMGQNDPEQTQNIYSISLIIHALIAVAVIVLAETVGLLIFHTVLNIPSDRISEAHIVYHLSVFTTVANVLRVPYRATIIAYEKMSFFTLITFVEILSKLGIIFLLPIVPFDKLLIYAFFVLITDIVILLFHKIYCNRKIESAHFSLCRKKELFNQIAVFSGWEIFGQFAELACSQGRNIILNVFYGVTLNAAMGIASQVNSTVYTFVANFQTAFKPQLIKLYAADDNDSFTNLLFLTSKMSFFLLLFFVLPLYINADFVMLVWLDEIPDYCVIFIRLMLLISLETALSGPLIIAIQATGDIKMYQLIASFFTILNLPLSFLYLWMGFAPALILNIGIGTTALVLLWRLFFLGRKINFPIVSFVRDVITPIIIISVISGVVTWFCHTSFDGWAGLIFSCAVSTVIIGSLSYLIGLNAKEKVSVQNFLKRMLLKHSS